MKTPGFLPNSAPSNHRAKAVNSAGGSWDGLVWGNAQSPWLPKKPSKCWVAEGELKKVKLGQTLGCFCFFKFSIV